MANCEHNGEEFSIKEVVQVEKKLIGKGYFEQINKAKINKKEREVESLQFPSSEFINEAQMFGKDGCGSLA